MWVGMMSQILDVCDVIGSVPKCPRSPILVKSKIKTGSLCGLTRGTSELGEWSHSPVSAPLPCRRSEAATRGPVGKWSSADTLSTSRLPHLNVCPVQVVPSDHSPCHSMTRLSLLKSPSSQHWTSREVCCISSTGVSMGVPVSSVGSHRWL